MSDALMRAYAALCLTPGASWEEVQASYKKLVKTWHPDLFRTPREKERAEAYLKEINAARALLKDYFKNHPHKSRPDTRPPPEPDVKPEPEPAADMKPKAEPAPESEPEPPPAPKTKAKPKPDAPPDFWSDLCKNLDLGPLTHDEPGWYEPFRRACDKVSGKHPGETILDYFKDPVDWSQNHKKRCLVLTIFLIAAFDRLVYNVNAPAQQEPLQRQTNPGLNFDNADEKRREFDYFEEKWRERLKRENPSGL